LRGPFPPKRGSADQPWSSFFCGSERPKSKSTGSRPSTWKRRYFGSTSLKGSATVAMPQGSSDEGFSLFFLTNLARASAASLPSQRCSWARASWYQAAVMTSPRRSPASQMTAKLVGLKLEGSAGSFSRPMIMHRYLPAFWALGMVARMAPRMGLTAGSAAAWAASTALRDWLLSAGSVST